MLYLQGIHNICSKHKIIQYLRNHIWHSWHLWPCNLPKIQNKFILILIWSGDNKTTQHSARVHSRTPIHTSREEERCITMLLEKSDKCFGTRRQNMQVWQNVAFVAVVIGKLLFFPPNTYLYVSQTVKCGRLWKEDCYNWLLTPSQPWRLY